MKKKEINFGIIGLGLMGREFASAVARWCHLLDDGPTPVLKGICNQKDRNAWDWYMDNFPTIEIATHDYMGLINSDKIDAIYCAVPHNMHEQLYLDILKSGKHLLGEKPFGIDLKANDKILEEINRHPDLVVRISSEFVYFPGAMKLINWIRERKFGRLIEVKAGFHHSSDMDLNKKINWKRMIEINGEYGCMGDLGFHIHLIPLRMRWMPEEIFADLQNIADKRLNNEGQWVPCETWDNATITCKAQDPDTNDPFSMTFETKRMMPGATNTWFLEVYGTEGSAKFTTHNPRAFYSLVTSGKEQGWTRVDIGPKSAIPTITGGIFEFGFSDAFQQMVGAYMNEFKEDPASHSFRLGTPEESRKSHLLMTAALDSHRSGKRVKIYF
jgi:predicted dehydrogenase